MLSVKMIIIDAKMQISHCPHNHMSERERPNRTTFVHYKSLDPRCKRQLHRRLERKRDARGLVVNAICHPIACPELFFASVFTWVYSTRASNFSSIRAIATASRSISAVC